MLSPLRHPSSPKWPFSIGALLKVLPVETSFVFGQKGFFHLNMLSHRKSLESFRFHLALHSRLKSQRNFLKIVNIKPHSVETNEPFVLIWLQSGNATELYSVAKQTVSNSYLFLHCRALHLQRQTSKVCSK